MLKLFNTNDLKTLKIRIRTGKTREMDGMNRYLITTETIPPKNFMFAVVFTGQILSVSFVSAGASGIG